MLNTYFQAVDACPYPGVVILSGLPGSGKSFQAEQILKHYGGGKAVVVSADHFWAEDYSDFDPQKLSQAHDQCMRNYLRELMLEQTSLVVVDNTNITAAEIAPYYQVARALKRRVAVLRMEVPYEICLERQTHGVPAEIMEKMFGHYYEPLPSYWTIYRVKPDGY